MNELIFESFSELDTQRLFLRQITQEDDKSLSEVLSDEVTCKYLIHNAVNDIASIKRMITGMHNLMIFSILKSEYHSTDQNNN